MTKQHQEEEELMEGDRWTRQRLEKDEGKANTWVSSSSFLSSSCGVTHFHSVTPVSVPFCESPPSLPPFLQKR